MSALREILVAFGVTVDQTEIVSAQANVEKLLDSFSRLVKSSAVVLGGKALAGFVEDTIAAANQVGILAARYGATTEATQELMAVSDAAGVHFTQLLHGFRAINTAAEKNASEFHELGINTRKSNGEFKSQVDLFWETGEALSKVTNDTHRTYLAQRLLGRAGQQLMPIFQGTKEEIEAFRKKIQETSTVFTDQFIGKARLATFSLQAMGRTWEKLAGIVTEQLLPAFNWTVDKLTELAKWFQELAKHSDAMNGLFAALAIGVGILTVQLAPLILTTALWAAGLALVFLVLEDFVAFIRGDGSLIGDAMDKWFGDVGGQDGARKAILGLWDKLKDFAKWLAAPSTWEGFVTTFKGIVDEITDYLSMKIRATLGNYLADKLGVSAAKPKAGEAGGAQQSKAEYDYTSGQYVDANREKPQPPLQRGMDWLGGKLEAGSAALSNWLLRGVGPEGAGEPSLPSNLPPLLPGGFLSAPNMSVAPAPSLQSIGGANQTSSSSGQPVVDSRQQTVQVTVQGNASASTARDVANATMMSISDMGRGRDAIGASVGISQ